MRWIQNTMLQGHLPPDMPNVADLTRDEAPAPTEPSAAGPSSLAPPAAASMTAEDGDDLELPEDLTTDVPLRARASRIAKRIIPTSISPPGAKGKKPAK